MSLSGPATATRLETTVAQFLVGRLPVVGVDAVHIPTWLRHVSIGGDALLMRIYTDAELRFAGGRIDRLATRLAAKEAALKALGTGVRGIALREIEVENEPTGQPALRLHGAAARRARLLEIEALAVSLCHEQEFALAVVVGNTPVG